MNASVRSDGTLTAGGPRLLPEYSRLTPAALLQHFQRRRAVTLFPIADPLETGREKIDAILAGRFEFNGETHELPLPLNWLRNPSQDVEWHILLHKFYFAVGLALAYRDSGDDRYLNCWMDLCTGWMRSVPAGFIATDVTGRRVQNWIYAHWYFVTRSPRAPVPPEFHLEFLASLEHQVNYICEHLTPKRNHRTLELHAVFLAGVAFPELADAAHWREFGLTELARNMQSDLLADGVHCELSTDYHHLALRNYLSARRIAAANGISVPASMDRQLQQALEFSMHAHNPDGIVPSFSDGDARGYLELLSQGHELFGREDFLYVASGGSQGVAPRDRVAAFPDGGYYVIRSGWGQEGRSFRDEQHLLFDCGPLGEGNHGHFDCLSFELAAFGRPLIVDPGRYTYSEAGETNWRVRFRGTAYHNTVEVDGRNQTRYLPRTVDAGTRHGKGTLRHRIAGPAPVACLHQRVSHPRFTYLCGSARSAEYDAIHTRHLAFAFGDYWVIADRLQASIEHSYDFRLHLTEHAQGATRIQRDAAGALVRSPHLLCAFDPAATHELALDDGFVSPRYGHKLPAPVVRASQYARNTWFHALIVPHAGIEPSLSVRVLSALRGSGLVLEIKGVGQRGAYQDLLCFGEYQGELPGVGRVQVMEGCAAVRRLAGSGADEWHVSPDARVLDTRSSGAVPAGAR